MSLQIFKTGDFREADVVRTRLTETLEKKEVLLHEDLLKITGNSAYILKDFNRTEGAYRTFTSGFLPDFSVRISLLLCMMFISEGLHFIPSQNHPKTIGDRILSQSCLFHFSPGGAWEQDPGLSVERIPAPPHHHEIFSLRFFTRYAIIIVTRIILTPVINGLWKKPPVEGSSATSGKYVLVTLNTM